MDFLNIISASSAVWNSSGLMTRWSSEAWRMNNIINRALSRFLHPKIKLSVYMSFIYNSEFFFAVLSLPIVFAIRKQKALAK